MAQSSLISDAPTLNDAMQAVIEHETGKTPVNYHRPKVGGYNVATGSPNPESVIAISEQVLAEMNEVFDAFETFAHVLVGATATLGAPLAGIELPPPMAVIPRTKHNLQSTLNKLGALRALIGSTSVSVNS